MRHRAQAYALVAAAAALPRLAVVLVERGDILADFTEKSDDLARTLVASGTFGFVAGEPSAYTQPLYGWFLAGVYWTAERHWLAVGLAQVAVAVGTALLVYEIGRRWISPRAGVLAAVAATLHPYLVWHDVHVNREILDGFLAAALVLATLAAADRRSLALAALAGATAGLAILGNARLLLLPLAIAAFLAWRRALPAAGVAVLAAAVVVAPWVIRNEISVGCAAITTDARALWKANDEATYNVLARGGWIDDVPDPPGAPLTPEQAASAGLPLEVPECEQMRYYRELVVEFWREHPGEKAKLAAQATRMLWDPRATRTEEGPGAGGFRERAREWLLPVYVVPLFALALAGVVVARRELVVLAVGLLLYVTATAAVFAGATRYRVPWDFLLALLAAAAVAELVRRYRPSSADR